MVSNDQGHMSIEPVDDHQCIAMRVDAYPVFVDAFHVWRNMHGDIWADYGIHLFMSSSC